MPFALIQSVLSFYHPPKYILPPPSTKTFSTFPFLVSSFKLLSLQYPILNYSFQANNCEPQAMFIVYGLLIQDEFYMFNQSHTYYEVISFPCILIFHRKMAQEFILKFLRLVILFLLKTQKNNIVIKLQLQLIHFWRKFHNLLIHLLHRVRDITEY